jgi:hypothetical protein
MNAQELHIIDIALEVLMSKPADMRHRRLKNAVYDCIRCFHGGEVWGEPYHVEMVEVNIATLSAILMEMGFSTPDCNQRRL